MRQAHALACLVLKDFSNPFSRHDFTRPQLFACLVLREMLRLSYRKTEAFLRDSMSLLLEIGMTRPPDHNTLWRAFDKLVETRQVNRMLDLQARMFAEAHLLKLSSKPLTIDSTCYEPRHRSRHYDRVCKKMRLRDGAKYTEKPGPDEVNRSRSIKAKLKVKQMPKLAIAVAAASHVILAARVHTGNGSDQPDFTPLLRRAHQRARVYVVVADAGYDSEKNHRSAREALKVRSVIPAKIGKPTKKKPTGRHRRNMHNRFARNADKRTYGQRSQSETVNSMMKRNYGDALRSIRKKRREREMLLRVVTHNVMLRC